ncbi:hypothetical protein AAH994_15045, partial [Weeksellaceae bacterium A-14]
MKEKTLLSLEDMGCLKLREYEPLKLLRECSREEIGSRQIPKSGAGTYNYKYNGKELQETGMYDYGARF